VSQAAGQAGRRRCPTCSGLLESAESGRLYRPFCSKRCQLIDLGKWFDEEYVIHTPLAARGDEAPDSERPLEPS